MNEYKYDVFICHSMDDRDTIISNRLKEELIKYRVPGNIKRVNQRARIGSLYVDNFDSEDSPAGEDVIKILDNSRYLVVVCSRYLPKSKRAMDIIERFWNRRRGQNILTVLVDNNPQESFPAKLHLVIKSVWDEGRHQYIDREFEIEPLAADVYDKDMDKLLKMLKVEKLRLIAPMLGCSFDDLRRRHYHTILKRTSFILTSVTIFILLLFLSLYSFFRDMDKQEDALLKQEQKITSDREKQKQLSKIAALSAYRYYIDGLDMTYDNKELYEKYLEFLKTRRGTDYSIMQNGSDVRKNDVFASAGSLAQVLAYLRTDDYEEDYIKLLERFDLVFRNELDWTPDYIDKCNIFLNNEINDNICLYIIVDQEVEQKDVIGEPIRSGDIVFSIEDKEFSGFDEWLDYYDNYIKYMDASLSEERIKLKFYRIDEEGYLNTYETKIYSKYITFIFL